MLLLCVTMVCSLAHMILACGLDQYISAVKQGAEVSFGGYEYQFSGGSDEARELFTDMTEDGRAVAVLTTTATYREANEQGLADIAEVTALTGPSRYGKLVEGEQPDEPGRIALSQEAATRMGAQIGDAIEIISDEYGSVNGTYTLTGVTINPAATSDVYATLVVEHSVIDEPAMWLSDEDLTSSGTLLDESGFGSISAGSRESAVSGMVDTVVERKLPGNSLYALLLCVMTVMLYTALIVTLFKGGDTSSGDCGHAVAASLQSVGCTKRRARWMVLRGGFVLMALGVLIGSTGGVGLMSRFAPSLGSVFDQQWVWSFGSVAVLGGFGLAALCVVVAAMCSAVLLFRKPKDADVPLSCSIRYYVVVGTILLVVGLLLVLSYYVVVSGVQGKLGALMAACGLAVLLCVAPWLASTPIQQSIVRRACGRTLPLMVMSAIICCLSASVSADCMLAATSTTMNGTLAVSRVSVQDVAYLSKAYPEIMDNAYVFVLADENFIGVRASDPESFACAQQAGKDEVDCYLHDGYATQTMVEFAEQGTPAGEFIGQAQPGLIDGNGQVGIHGLIHSNGASPTELSFSTRVDAEPSDLLDGDRDRMPGIVLDVNSPILEEFDITLSESRNVIVPDFGDYPDDVKNAFRSELITRCGYSFIGEDDSIERRQLIDVAVAVPCFAAVLLALVFGTAISAAMRSQRALFDLMRQLGAKRA